MDNDDGINEELLRWYAQFSDGHGELRAELQKRVTECDGLPPPEVASCAELEAYFARFNQGHEEHREQLFDRLRETAPTVVSPHSTRREWLVGIMPRTAASLLVASAGGGLLLNSLSRPAYAIEDIVHQLHTAKRLYLRGSVHDEYPIEVYIERPSVFWAINHQFMLDGSGQPILGVSGHRASDGKVRYLHENAGQEVAIAALDGHQTPYAYSDLPIWSQIELESLISEVVGEGLFHDAAGFALTKQLKKDGNTCDLFERNVSANSIQRLVVDAKSGKPMSAAGVRLDPQTQSERISWRIDEIDMNLKGPPDHIRFKQFEPNEIGPCPSPVERFSRMPAPSGAFVPFVLRIGESCLTCWTADHTVIGKPSFQLVNSSNTPTIAPIYNLGATHDGTSAWNWVLLQLPDEFFSARIEVEYDTLDLGSLTSRRMKLKRRTPIDIGAAGVEEVLQHMATPAEAQRILKRVRARMPQV